MVAPRAGGRRRGALDAALGGIMKRGPGDDRPLTLYTFGDSILDCARYNEHGVTPGQLLVRNDDRLFPEFRGRDLRSRRPARLEERARDGATVRDLPSQGSGLRVEGERRAWAGPRGLTVVC
jgi:hypothetical protein